MDHPFLFVLGFMATILGIMFYLNWQHQREEAFKNYLKTLPDRVIFPKVSYRIWQLTAISWYEADLFLIPNGFILAGEGPPDYFFSHPNKSLHLPSTTIEWVLKSLEANGKKLIVTAATNEITPRYEKFHFSFRNEEVAEKVIRAMETYNLRTTMMA